MSEAGGMTSTDYRLGYHKPIDRPWQPVIYSAVPINGTLYAVIDGCILIGTVEQQEEIGRRIKVDNSNTAAIFTDPDFKLLGGAIKGASYRWSSARIPVEIAPDLPSPARVGSAIDEWQAKTKLRFPPKGPGDKDWIRFSNAEGCASSVGRQGGMQQIFLGANCSVGNAIHEIGHAIGLYPEQSRSDRDQYVEIKWANIQPAMKHNFNLEDSVNLGGYDYGSIMHYPAKAFSANTQDTIVAKKPLGPGVVMGQRKALSATDIASVAVLYP